MKLRTFIVREWLFLISVTGLVATSLVLRRIPSYSFSDFEVLFTLFVFLVVERGLEREGVLSFVAFHMGRGRFVYAKLTAASLLLSAFVTNDVAVITLVPVALMMELPNRSLAVALVAAAANAGSMFTPFGNPQNMFIYFHYGLSPIQFFRVIAPVAFLYTAAVFGFSMLLGGTSALETKSGHVNSRALVLLAAFVLLVLSILKLLPPWVEVLSLVLVLFLDRSLLKVDYILLGTFFCFFGFTDNLARWFSFSISGYSKTVLVSSFLSQLMSNVPAALFLADFVRDWRPLLVGVNIGGFGNLIGSLATLIAYRILVSRYPEEKGAFITFHVLGYALFVLGILFVLLSCGLK